MRPANSRRIKRPGGWERIQRRTEGKTHFPSCEKDLESERDKAAAPGVP